jgi:colanic acid biosynthesis glycosyl transferase WcaI
VKVTVWGINYAPELTGISPYNVALCEFLRASGVEVRMVTTFAYYPQWKKAPGDSGKLYRTDEIRGIPVERCWHYVPEKVSAVKRILHEATFVTTSFSRLLFLPSPDVYVVVSPPLLLGAAAWILSRLKRRPFMFHVQDLQPDAAVGLGMLKKGLLVRALYGLEKIAYAKAARVSGISAGMLKAFERKGVPAEKRVYFPNGVTLGKPGEGSVEKGRFRSRLGIGAEIFLVVYSGNLGVKQGLDIMIEAARLLPGSDFHFVICGDGARREHLEALVRTHGLSHVRMLPLQPKDQYRELLADADISLITEQKGAGQAFFPSKLLGTLGAGSPVLAVADETSELYRATREGGFGLTVEPDEPGLLAEALQRLQKDPSLLLGMGECGKAFVARFDFGITLPAFLREIEGVAKEN